MKSKLEILEEKLMKHYPISMKTINDAIQYAIDNNISYSKGGILTKEIGDWHSANARGIVEEFKEVLVPNVYAVATVYPDQIQLEDGQFYNAYGVYIFLNKEEFEEYSKYRDWSDAKPHVVKYRHLNIYKKKLTV